MKTVPADQKKRERFATELDRNFSVIAAAGTGKTTAITKRIVEIAQRKPDWLPRLVVVTFTNRAADEMQQRARQRIFEAGVALPVLAAFNRAFFGTIHSFCTKLLATRGHRLGLPSRLELISDDEELWNDFVQRTDSVGDSLSPENRRKLLRHVQLRDLMELGRRGKLPLTLEQREPNCPDAINIEAVINYRGSGVRIDADKEALRHWKERFESGSDFVPLIEWATNSQNFVERRQSALRDFNDWLSCCALKVAAEVQAKYRQFRAAHGVVTFDDQVALALELTQNAEAISQIRAKDYIVILDEAQDTDPQQFEILLEITRPPSAVGRWIENPQEQPPRPGRFCMVGDFEQSIYGDRADLKKYRRIHDALIGSDAGKQLEFSVTFRLDQNQIDFVNKCFGEILNDRGGQVGFIELEPRPQRLPGQVVRLDVTPGNLNPDAHDREKAKAEATQLARWIKEADLDKLRARSWGELAILCPRKNWFAPIAEALLRVGIDSQVQSETDVKGDSPAHAWFSAVLAIMTQPRCAFEIVGVLREVFGISDHDLAVFCDGYGDRFQIERETGGSGIVAVTLDVLVRIHTEIADKPLFNAVQRIVECTQLRARLQTLPRGDFDDLDKELDVLVQSAATAEAEGMTLEQFAELLRANFTAEREAGVPRTDAIQLITCQKAKGLEWDAVIVPFFSRQIHTGDEDFPRLIVNSQTQEAMVAFSKSEVAVGAKDALKRARVQEMERLLYVALTRARHTLVIAADRELFAKKRRDTHSDSLTVWFRSEEGQPNAAHIAGLEVEASVCSETRAHQLRTAHSEKKPHELARLPKPVLNMAQSRAADFYHQLHPSNFIAADGEVESTGSDEWKEAESEFRARTMPSTATRYGLWWHAFAQKIPWNSKPDVWQAAFDENVPASPDPSRARREWKLLRQYVSGHRDFVAGNIFAEMPFFWRFDQRKCLEGIMDLAMFRPEERKWFLRDWKTNQIKRGHMGALCAYYRPQIAAYWKAVAEMTKQPVSASIYSTATGQLVVYEEKELADEWERLKMLAAAQFQTAVSRDESDQISRFPRQLEFGDW
jgi:ATP-dependent exoDNAse (exonuclease V) beta subunit